MVGNVASQVTDPWLDAMTEGMVMGDPIPIRYVWGVTHVPEPWSPRDMKVVRAIFFDWVERVQAVTEALEDYDVNEADHARDLWLEAESMESTNLSEWHQIQAIRKDAVRTLRLQGLGYQQIGDYVGASPASVIDADLGLVRYGKPRDYLSILRDETTDSPTASWGD